MLLYQLTCEFMYDITTCFLLADAESLYLDLEPAAAACSLELLSLALLLLLPPAAPPDLLSLCVYHRIDMLTFELSYYVLGMPNDAYTKLSRSLISCSTLSQEYCKLIV